MLLEALAACAGVTLRSLATALLVPVAGEAIAGSPALALPWSAELRSNLAG